MFLADNPRSAPEPRRLHGAQREGALDVAQSLVSRAVRLRRALPVCFAGLEDVFTPIDLEANREEGLLYDPGLQLTKEHSEIGGVISEPCGDEVDVALLVERNRPARRKPSCESHGRGEIGELEGDELGLADSEVVAQFAWVRHHATTIAVRRRLSPDRLRSFSVGAASSQVDVNAPRTS